MPSAVALTSALQVADDRVVLQQVRQRGGVGQVVDGHEVDVVVRHRGPHDVAADAPEPVDPHSNCHCRRPPVETCQIPNIDCSALKPLRDARYTTTSSVTPYGPSVSSVYLLYSLATAVVLVACAPYFLYQALRHSKYLGSLRQRLGYLPVSLNLDAEPSIWVHAVSVGEVLAARPVIAELRKQYPALRLFLSTTTRTGQQLARQSVADVDGTFYLPFDWTFTVRRTLRRVRPRLFVMVESEIWPNLLRECRARGREDRGGERAHLPAVVPALPAGEALVPARAGRHRSLLRAGRRNGAAADRARRRPGARGDHRQPEVRRAADRAGAGSRPAARAAFLPRPARPPGADGGQHAARARKSRSCAPSTGCGPRRAGRARCS